MSTEEIIALANSIVKAIANGERMKAPQLNPWELDEVMWWADNLGGDLL